MQITVKRLKKSKLGKLVKKLAALNEQKAEIGYFQGSGDHPTADMNYATLAFIHAFPIKDYHPTRNIFSPIKPMVGSSKDAIPIKKLLQRYLKWNTTLGAEDVLDEIGKEWTQKGKDVFGNTALLEVTSNLTPLIDDGHLKKAFGYRTTLNYTVRNDL